MPILKFRNKEAEKIEEIARERAIARQEAALRLKSRSGIMPPPGADLLGIWSVIEESIVAKTKVLPVSAVFSNLHFETLGREGNVLGKITVQGKKRFHGKMMKDQIKPGVKSFELEGKIVRPGLVLFMIQPTYSFPYSFRNLTTGPHICEAEWNGFEMVGYQYCNFTGATDRFIAMKVE